MICCRSGAEVLVAAPFVGAVLGPWGPERSEGSGADDNGVGGGEAGTKGAGA